MANLNRVPKIATTTTHKMSRFNMGVQSKYRETKRLSASTNQTIISHKGKVYLMTVDRIYTHNDGSMTGNIIYNGVTYHVHQEPNKSLWLMGEKAK